MDKNNLDSLRHSCAHLLAAAVLFYYPKAKLTLGPSIENGFYYDVDFGPEKFSEEEFSKMEQKMHELVKKWGKFEGIKVNSNEAMKQWNNNEYKQELIKGIVDRKEEITIYKAGEFSDLCRGGHVDNPKEQLKYFKLLSIAGAYWRGNAKNKMLTRIYGTCFPTKEELENHLKMLEEAKKRDHRKIGETLELFTISNLIGSGLPIFLPKGEIIRSTILKYLTDIKKSNCYQFVWSPHIARSETYHISQHWGKYDAMFAPMKLDKEEYVLKPMNCPHHFQVYLNRPRSYKELPFRIAENGTVYRNEKSGEVSGLVRVKALTIDDTHTFIRYSQTMEEVNEVLKMIIKILNTFGFNNYVARISIGDKKHPEKYLGSPEEWERAENALKRGADNLKIKYEVGEGEAAFYGPKIDIMVNDSLGRSWQLSTVQLDYNQPKNFNMKYVDEEGKEDYPAILHIAMIGSIERFMGILIEHYAGAFPLWLSPVQVVILPISEKFLEPAQKVKDELEKNNIRVELNADNKSLGGKIRQSTLQKIPFMIIIGEKEDQRSKIKDQKEKELFVTVRTREGKDLGMMEIKKFINQIKSQIENFS